MRIAQLHDPLSWRYKQRVPVDVRMGSYVVKRILTETLPVEDVAHLLKCTKASINNEEITAFCRLMHALRLDPEAVELAQEYFSECDAERTRRGSATWETFTNN